MPWSAKTFRGKHNNSLTAQQSMKAAAQASAMLKSGVPEGEAIATANKHARDKRVTKRDRLYGKGK